MNVLQTQTGATAGQMKALRDQAIALGADLKLPGTSAQDASEAMLALAKGGLSVRDTMQATRGVLVASAAAQIDNAEAAEIVANALNAFNLQGREAGRVADLLAGAANAATGDMPDFAAALRQVGASAHALGVPIGDTVTLLTELAQAGIQGQDAGTSLKTMFQRLIPSTVKAKGAVADLGIKLFDAKGEFIGARETIARYSEALGPLSTQQRVAALNTIFGTDAQRAANIIFGKGVGVYDKLSKRVNRQGQAARLAAAQNKGLAGAWDGLISTVETLQLQLGQKLAPAMESVVRFLSANLPGAVNAAIGAFENLGGTAEFVGENFGTIGPILIGLVSAFTAYKAIVVTTAAVQKVLATATIALNTANILATGGTRSLAAAQAAQAATASTASAKQIVFNSALLASRAGLAGLAAAAGVGVVTALVLLQRSGLLARDTTEGLTTAMNDAKRAADSLGDALRNLKSDTLDVRQAEVDRANAARRLTDINQRLGKLADKGKKDSKEFADLTRDQTQAEIDLARAKLRVSDTTSQQVRDRQAIAQAERQVTRALDDARKAANRQSVVLDRNLNPALANSTTVSGRAATAARRGAIANRIFDKATGELALAENDLANKFRASDKDKAQAHRRTVLMALAAADLRTKLGRIPTDKEINVHYRDKMDHLIEQARILRGEIALIPDTKTVTIQFAQAHATPLVSRMAGGPLAAHQPAIIGEHGPEIWIPDVGGVVVPNHKAALGDHTALNTGIGDLQVDVWIGGERLDDRVDKRVEVRHKQSARVLRAGRNW